MGPGADDDDPFASMHLDDDFVRSAAVHEPTAAQRNAVVDLVAAQKRRSAIPTPPLRRRRSQNTWIALVLVLLLGAWYANERTSPFTGGWSGAHPLTVSFTDPDMVPTPQLAQSSAPLGRPAIAPASDAYEFIMTQPRSDDPVAYDPCRPIHVVVNTRLAPASGEWLIDETFDQISRATGLQFVVEGTTDEPMSEDRRAYQPERYGDRWAPVLVTWTDETEVPEFRDDIIGIGGSSAFETDGGVIVYVSGIVALDGRQVDQVMRYPNGESHVRAVLLHELGHLVGLAHVDDDSQLMYGGPNTGRVTFNDGDRAGLAHLGRGRCVERL